MVMLSPMRTYAASLIRLDDSNSFFFCVIFICVMGRLNTSFMVAPRGERVFCSVYALRELCPCGVIYPDVYVLPVSQDREYMVYSTLRILKALQA